MVNQPDDPNQAQAWISGTPPDQTIDFYIPRGNTGPRGPVGPIGPSLAVGSVATVTGPAAPGTVGPKGDTGPKGDPGGFTTGTILTTANNLNDVSAAGIYVVGINVASTALNYPALTGTSGGDLIVYERGASSTANGFQEFWPTSSTSNGNVFYRRTKVNSVWSPWRSFTGSRVDQAAGRVIYQWDDLNNREQMVYGDTGVRDVRALFDSAKVTVGTGKMRRTGHVVELRILGMQAVAGVSGNVQSLLTNLPYGFRNEHTVTAIATQGFDSLTRADLAFNGGGLTVRNLVQNPSTSFTLIWTTLDAWPTTLPGDPVGSLPSA
ncbi:minor tail protein [Arthrobacter phage ScienceWizSam]|uniref:Minor tail protein n=1 Tax=Arthrobacter phage ScienceWizSam TaxID=2927283 RepID=A0A9E7TDQ5_9CAUD|nr:minor tail protein [Arthrobacter phage ScienceWizSam]UUG69267.1 minor tail protein [Arthrobacter phage ScienceWizSam]